MFEFRLDDNRLDKAAPDARWGTFVDRPLRGPAVRGSAIFHGDPLGFLDSSDGLKAELHSVASPPVPVSADVPLGMTQLASRGSFACVAEVVSIEGDLLNIEVSSTFSFTISRGDHDGRVGDRVSFTITGLSLYSLNL